MKRAAKSAPVRARAPPTELDVVAALSEFHANAVSSSNFFNRLARRLAAEHERAADDDRPDLERRIIRMRAAARADAAQAVEFAADALLLAETLGIEAGADAHLARPALAAPSAAEPSGVLTAPGGYRFKPS